MGGTVAANPVVCYVRALEVLVLGRKERVKAFSRRQAERAAVDERAKKQKKKPKTPAWRTVKKKSKRAFSPPPTECSGTRNEFERYD